MQKSASTLTALCRGVIVLRASVAAQDGQIGQIIYGSAKAGVNDLVLPMAHAVASASVCRQ